MFQIWLWASHCPFLCCFPPLSPLKFTFSKCQILAGYRCQQTTSSNFYVPQEHLRLTYCSHLLLPWVSMAFESLLHCTIHLTCIRWPLHFETRHAYRSEALDSRCPWCTASDSPTITAEGLQSSEISHTDYCDSLKEFLWVFLQIWKYIFLQYKSCENFAPAYSLK